MAWYLDLCLRGKEWKRLRERFAKESCGAVKGFPLGFPALQGFTTLGKRGGEWILNSLSRALLQLVPVRLFGTGQAAHIHEEKKRGGSSLILRCQGGRRRPQVEATDALVIQLTPCCQSVLAVMLAKAGVSAGLPTIGFEPMTLAV